MVATTTATASNRAGHKLRRGSARRPAPRGGRSSVASVARAFNSIWRSHEASPAALPAETAGRAHGAPSDR